jgi:hypothetical protein
MGPDSFVLWIVRELGHEFAFSSEPIEFFRSIHRLASQRRLWTFALNRRAIMFSEGLVVAVTPRLDTATATRVWQRNAPRGIWFRAISEFSRVSDGTCCHAAMSAGQKLDARKRSSNVRSYTNMLAIEAN